MIDMTYKDPYDISSDYKRLVEFLDHGYMLMGWVTEGNIREPVKFWKYKDRYQCSGYRNSLFSVITYKGLVKLLTKLNARFINTDKEFTDVEA